MGRGGALRSLVRSFENLEGVSVPTTFELYLEGAVAPKDDIQLLSLLMADVKRTSLVDCPDIRS